MFVKLVKSLDGGAAVGHANKGTKGRLVRELMESGAAIGSLEDFVDWASAAGYAAAADREPGVVLLAARV